MADPSNQKIMKYFGREKKSSYNQEISIEAPDESYFSPPEFNPDASPKNFLQKSVQNMIFEPNILKFNNSEFYIKSKI